MDEDQIEELQQKLAALKEEHRDLDAAIDRLMQTQPIDFVALQRMKKRKLGLKDMINRMESDLLPDIIA
tara:strand:- start:301 stop:507 length:207 start_codon:yes stop_codon:yes gene_type:complete